MKIPILFKEYIWLIETIYQAGRITFAESNQKWQRREESGGVEFSRTTFNRHRDAILDMFGVVIECDRKDGNRYYIYNKEVLRDNSIANWLYSTLSVGNMLDENMGLQNRILLESIPSGSLRLKQITKAMRDSRRISMTYRKYGADESRTYTLEPYCVKLFKRRWYLLAKMSMGAFAVFSLDRILEIEMLSDKFTVDPDFDAEAYFGECYGIVVGDGTELVRVVLRAYGQEPYYLRDLPLHHSQRELESTDEYTDFELLIRPTSDFKASLMARGEWLQVISPQWLADDIICWHKAALERYKSVEK